MQPEPHLEAHEPRAGLTALGVAIPVLALDLSAQGTGWALRRADGQRFSGVEAFPLGRGDSPGMRWLRFRRWLADLLKFGELVECGLVAYEQAHHRGGYATEVALGLVTHVQAGAAFYGCEHTAVHSATLKKWATGSGRASKDDMLEAARARNPDLEVEDDNHADALLLLDYVLEAVGEQ